MHFSFVNGDEYFDEISIKIEPRFKESGLSGDEWRVSALLELKRKGQTLYEHRYGNLRAAAAFLPGVFMTAGLEVAAEARRDEAARWLCMQPGCSETATVTYRLKAQYCHDGHESPPMAGGMYRRFCATHAVRGDCGLEDADDNYELVEASLADLAGDSGDSGAARPRGTLRVRLLRPKLTPPAGSVQ